MRGRKVLPLAILAAVFLSLVPRGAHAQLSDLVERYTGINGEGYLTPLATALGAGLNSGLFGSADIPTSGLRFRVEIRAMQAYFSDDDKVFQATTEDSYFQPETTVTVPTIIGDGEGLTLEGMGGTHFVFPGGLGYNSFFLGVPQLLIGGIYGTEVLLRWLPTVEIDEEIGDFSFFGFGVRHKISQYFSNFPVDVAFGLYLQNIDVGDVLSANLLAVNLSASKTFTLLTLYGGLCYESANVHAEYTFSSGGIDENIEIDMTGKNRFRFLMGVGLNLFVVHINADFSLGHQNVLCLGLGFGV
jgi:hypothetical protein